MRKSELGISLISIVLLLVVVGGIGLVGLRVAPTVSEFSEIKRTMEKVKDKGDTVANIRGTFDLAASAGYITSVTGKDLNITKTGDKVVISVAYSKKIPLVEPVFLLIEYSATTN
jgi:hypothetical protein